MTIVFLVSQKPLPYNFAWGVKDEYYNDFAQEETADGKGYVSGSYRVALPGIFIRVPSTLPQN